MKVLILGASGSTGRLVVQQVVKRNIGAKIIVRDIEKVSIDLRKDKLVECIVGNIIQFDQNKIIDLIKDCDAVISCLGHNISLKGIFGKPRLLVTDSIKKVCEAIEGSKKERVKLILMNTVGVRNKIIDEKYSLKDIMVLSLLRIILPPQKDNEEAANYLSTVIGKNNQFLEWTAVRPDSLIDEDKESQYELIETPKRSPVFDPGKTSRINVSHFMCELLCNDSLWNEWKFRMPVVYNIENMPPKQK